ncbi:hypothetical protein PENTCL1PPCAC_1696, partial [Pristionchus entomophagus]
MPYYARSAYYPLPGYYASFSAPQAGAQLPQQQQQQQQYAAPAVPQIDQAFLRQQAQAQAQAQQLAYQQQQQQQLQQQQYIEQQNRQLAQQQYYQQQQQLQQQQYAAQQQRLQQEQQYALQQQQQQQQQQLSRQQQRSGYQAAPAVCQQAHLYKSSEYVQSGGGYQTGGALSQPLRRVPYRADVNTAIENQEAPYQSFGHGLTVEQQRSVSTTYNPYVNYGKAVAQSPIRPQRASQREPSEYAYDGLNPVYRQSQQQQQQYAQGNPSELGARSLNVPTTVVLDANNNAAPALLPPRSPARGYGGQQQRGYGSGAQAESAYIAIPNDLHYAQNNQQRAYNNYGQESRPVYASSSRTNQIAPSTPKLKPAAARELYAALSSENVRTALERDAPITLLAQAPAFSTYNGQRVQGRAFVVPADQKFSEYNLDDLNGLRSVID